MPIEWWQLAFAAFTSVLMATITAWAQIQNRKWESRTQRWEEMTKEVVDKSKIAADAGVRTQDLLKENTKITQQTATNTNDVLLKLQQASLRAMDMRNKMREKIAGAERSVLTDELDAINEQFIVNEHEIAERDKVNHDKSK